MADSTFSLEILTHVDEGNLNETIKKVEELHSLAQDIPADEGNGDSAFYIGESFSQLNNVLNQTKMLFSQFGTGLATAFLNPLNSIRSSMDGFKKSLIGIANAGENIDLEEAMTKALTMREMTDRLSSINKLTQKDLGWTKDAFASKMPVLMSRLINPEVKRLSETQFMHGAPNLNRYVDSLLANRAIREALNTTSGISMSNEQARANLELGLVMYNRRAAQAFGADAVAKAPFHKASAALYPHDIIPEQFRAAYYGMGHSKKDDQLKAREAFIASLPTQGSSYVDRSIYKQLREYVNNNENGWALHDILRDAGIMTLQNGERHWANSLTLTQASLLGGLSARELYNAKRGYAFYDANPNDPANDNRVDHRMSRRVQAQLALMDILSQDKRITPYDNYDLSAIEQMNSDYVVRPGKKRLDYIRGTKVTETGTPDQFVMPITAIDPRSGKLIYRDPSWQKKTSLFEETEDDQFAIMTDNPLVELTRQIGYKGKKTGIAYGHGNGTFGYGRDETGKAIYDTPPIIKLNASQFYDTDSSGFNHTLNPQRGKILESIMKGNAFSYGDSDYEYAYQGDNAVYMIERGLKQKINDWYEERNLPSFFQGLNEGGLESIPEYDKLIKQINGMKKGSSTAQKYEDVFGALEGRGKNGTLNTRVANLSSWFKALGYADEDIPDGAAFGDASVFKNGPLQMRSAVGFGKYVLNPYNLKTLFGMATREIPKDAVIDESYGNNWLFSRNKDGEVDVWMPSISATEEDVEALRTGKRKNQRGDLVDIGKDELRNLRESKFFVANTGDIDQILSDKTAKQYQAFRYLSGKHYAKEYFGGDESKLESLGQIYDAKSGKYVDRYDKKTGLVTLTPEEQGAMHARATPSYMVMRSAWDYANDPTLMSQQTAAAMGFDEELMRRSDSEFERRIFRLSTAEGRIEALKANPFYERRLNQNKNFAYSSEATAYIEKQIRALEEAQLAGYVALSHGEDGIKALNQVAAITPGALIEPVLKAAGLDDTKINQAVRMLLPSQMDANGMIYSNAGLKDGQKMMARRNPDAAAQGIQVGSYFNNKDVRNVMRELGVSDEMASKAMWFSQRQMYSLNTGDFDGDTVNAYIGLPTQTLERNQIISDQVAKAKDEYEKALKLRNVDDAQKKQQVSVAQARMDALTRYYASTQTMGGASKILREAMNLPDDDPTKWKRIYEGMKLYDFASSDMRTKGLDPTISDLGLETIKGGNSFERFLAHMRKQSGKEDEDIREAHLGRDIFKTNLPSYHDPQGIVGRLMAGQRLLEGRSDYSNFSGSMRKLMDMEYGTAKTPEAEAARWYAKQYEKTAYGRLLTQKDLAKGDQLAYDWLRSMNARGVRKDDEEFLQYGRFSKRMDFLHGKDAMTYDALSEKAAELQAEYQRTGNEETRARWGLIQKALFNHESFEQDFENIDQIENKELRRQTKQAAKDAKAISESIAAEEELENQEIRKGNYWSNPRVTGNWSNFKHWVKKPVVFKGAKQISSTGAPADTDLLPVDFYSNPADRVATASRELFDDQFETEHILIGNIMHKAFENYFKAIGTGTLGGRTIDSFFTDLVTGDHEYARKLKEKGYSIQKTSVEGEPERYEARGIAGSGLEKLNNLLPTNLNKGVSAMADFLTALDNAGFDIEHPANIEGGFVQYDKDGHYLGFDDSGKYEMKMRVPVRNAAGEIQKDDQGNIIYDETKTTHARPDLMLRKKGTNDLYVVDYKSSREGAVESLVQSGFYTSVIDTLAKRALTGKDEEGHELSAAERESLQAFTQAGHLDNNGKYISHIKGAIGFDPRTKKSVMVERTDENAEWFDEGVKLAQEALSYKMIDASGLLSGGSAYARAAIDHQRINKQVEDKVSSIIDTYNSGKTNTLDDKTRDFFLSRYQADRDTLSNVRSSLYREEDRPERAFNRFMGYERRLKEALPDEVVQAVMQSYSNEDGFIDKKNPFIRELSDEMKEKARMLSKVQALGMDAAIRDWDKAGEDIPNMLKDVKQTSGSTMLENVNRRIKQAASSRDFLLTRTALDKDGQEQALFKEYIKNNQGEFQLAPSFLSPRERAEMFATDSEDKNISSAAKNAKRKYLESLDAEEYAMETIKASFKDFRDRDSKAQDSEWSKITGEIKDPVTAFSDGLNTRIDEAKSKIDEWNADVIEWMNKIRKGDVDDSMVPEVEAFIADRQQRVNKANKALNDHTLEQNYINEQKRTLGLEGDSSPAERAERWKQERRAVLSKEALNDQKSARELEIDELLKNGALSNSDRVALSRESYNLYSKRKEKRKTAERIAQIDAEGSLFQTMWEEQSRQRIDDFNRSISGKPLTRDESIKRAVDSRRWRALDMATSSKISEAERAQWEKIVLDEDYWKNAAKEEENRYDNDAAVRQMLRAQQLAAVDRQMAARSRSFNYSQEAYGRQRRQALFGNSLFGRNYMTYENRRASLQQQREAREDEIAGLRDQNSLIEQKLKTEKDSEKRRDYETKAEENRKRITQANKEIAITEQEIGKLSNGGALLSAAFDSAGQAISRLGQRLGRQMFQRALQETKQFVQQFNKSMTEIQMITLKSDSEMEQLGSGLIDKAQELKMNVSDITSISTDLYRQGLTDEEMNERMDVIAKFSKVSGAKPADATKLITTAINTGLVSNAQTAADIVTALGDNAATNAAQIEKGVEKAGAAAAVDGTTFSQLASMLTAITATTQVTGNVAGTTLNSIFGRMNKIGNNELIEDENGNKISGSTISTLLRAQGIETFRNGEKRSTFDILKELSTKWSSISDAEQQQLATAIAGTRQYSNFSAIMLGMAEGDMDKYLGLADKSEGIVDEKYEIYTRNLEAAIASLRTTWDGLVDSLKVSGGFETAVNFLTQMLQGVQNLTESLGGLKGIIPTVLPMLAGLALLKTGNPIMMGIGAGVLGVGAAVSYFSGQSKNEEVKTEGEIETERYKNYKSNIEQEKSANEKLISETKELGQKFDAGTISGEETDQLESNLRKLQGTFSGISSAASGAAISLQQWKTVVAEADEAAKGLAEQNENVIKTMQLTERGKIYDTALDEIEENNKNNPLTQEGIMTLRSAQTTFKKDGRSYFSEKLTNLLQPYGFEDAADSIFGNAERTSQGGYTLDSSNRLGFLTSVLGYQKAYGEPIRGKEFSEFSKDEDKENLLLNLVGFVFDNKHALRENFLDKEGKSLYDELSSAYGSDDKNKFIEDFKNGFKDNPDLQYAVNSILADIVFGRGETGSKVGALAKGETDKNRYVVEDAFDKALENTYDYTALNADTREAVRANLKQKMDEMNEKQIEEYMSSGEMDKDIRDEAEKARKDEEAYLNKAKETGVVTPRSISDVVTGKYGTLTGKERKYDQEYLDLLRDVSNAKTVEDLRNLDVKQHTTLINEAGDTELLKMWSDIYQNNGQGVYNMSDLKNYLENKVYGSSTAQMQATNLQTGYKLSQTSSLLDRIVEGGERGEDIISSLASATGLDVSQVRDNFDLAQGLLEQQYAQSESDYLSSISQYVDKAYGERIKGYTGATGVSVTEKRTEIKNLEKEINESLKGTGVTATIGSNGKVSYGFKPSDIPKHAGIMDYSTQYTNAELAGFAKQLADNGGNWSEMFSEGGAFYDWGDEQINAVAAYSPALAKYLKMSDEQRKSAEGQALKQKYEIQFETEGLSTLENAGELLEGTAALVEKLRKGGKFKIEAQLEIESEAFESSQTLAKVLNGTAAEQAEAIMSYTGIKAEEYYNDPTRARERFDEKWQMDQEAAAKSAAIELAALTDEADRERFIEKMKSRGLINVTDPETLKRMDSTMNFINREGSDETQRAYEIDLFKRLNGWEYDETTGTFYDPKSFSYDPNFNPDVIRMNPYAGAQKQYTDAELYRARQAILDGSLTADIDAELHNAALTSGGREWQKYQRLKAAYEAMPNNGRENEDERHAAYDAMRAQRSRAITEEGLTEQEVLDAERLEEARLNSGTLGGMYAYAQEQYRQNNKGGLAADSIFGSLATVKNAEDLIKVMGDSRNKDNWKDLMNASPELAKKLSDLGMTMDGENWDVSALVDSSDQLTSNFYSLIEAVAGASSEFNKYKDAKNTGEKYQMASDYLAGNIYDEDAQFAALGEFLPSDVASDIGYKYSQWAAANENYEKWKNEYTTAQQAGAPAEVLDRLRAAEPRKPGSFDWESDLSDFDKEYVTALTNGIPYGQSGLSDIEIYNGLMGLYNRVGSVSGVSGPYGSDSYGYFNNLVSGTQYGADYFAAQMALEDYNRVNNTSYSMKNLESYAGNAGAIGQINDALSGLNMNYQQATENAEQFHSELAEKGVEAYNKYNKSGETASRILALAAKGGNDLKQGMALSRKEAQKFQDQMTALEKLGKATNGKAKGKTLNKGDKGSKKTLDFLAELTPDFSADELAEMTIDEIQDLFAGAGEDVQRNATSLYQNFLDQLHLAETVDVSKLVDLNADGVIDSSEIEQQVGSQLSAAQQRIIAVMKSFEGVFAKAGISVEEIVNGIIAAVTVEANGSGKYNGGGGGGGGGGGESDAQKMLKRHKHEVAEAEHKVKMEEIYQTHYDFINDYDAYVDSLGKEEQAYADLSAVYERQIGELEGMMGSLEAYSDDWWSVKEALDAAKESLADVQNKIDAIETKRVDIIVQKQENEDKPTAQKQSLWEQKARGYQIRGQFESYAVSENERIKEIEEQRKQNEEQIAELEKTLAETTEGGDAWLKARDQLWAMQTENATLANDAEEARRALATATVQQYQTDLENRLAPRTHVDNMLSTYGQLYQTNRQYDDYRAALTQQNEVGRENIGLYTQYRDQLIEYMATLEEGSEAWYAARDAIYQYDEALAQATASEDERKRAIEQSYVDELKQKYEELNKDLTHTDNILKAQQDRYDKNNNFTMYQQVLSERLEVTRNKLAELETQLQGYLDLQGEITEGTDAWDALKESAQSTAEQIESAKNEEEELIRLQSQSKFEHDQEVFERQDNLDQHSLRMIQYEQTMYQNRGEYRNMNTMLEHENRLRAEMAQRTQDYIEVLKEDLALAEVGSDEYYKIAEAIYKAEENMKQHTNAIEKNTETMKKNEEQILKTHQTLINTIDNELKTREKERRERLAAEVNIQTQILNIIRNRYKQEWAIVKSDLDVKKKALQEEKALIAERLKARTTAEDREEKHAQLTELKRQLSIVSSDPTRTKDAKDLQKQIDDMEKEIARSEAQDEVTATQERLDEQMKAYDEFAAYQEQKLNEMLKDANSTQLWEEMSAAMGTDDMSREERIENYLDWIKQNDDNYKYGTEAMRMQLEQNNTDSWNKMLGWIETYWDEVHEIIDGGVETMIDFMKQSSAYQFAEEEASRKLMEWGWKEQFEDYENARKDDAEWNHDHDEIVTQIDDEVMDINRGILDMYGLQRQMYSFLTGIEFDYIRPTDVDPDAANSGYKDYAGVGRKTYPVGTDTGSGEGGGSGGGGGGSGGGSGGRRTKYDVSVAPNGMVVITAGPTGQYNTYDEAARAGQGEASSDQNYAYRRQYMQEIQDRVHELFNTANRNHTAVRTSGIVNEANRTLRENTPKIKGPNDEGGLIDFTGLAWVDGTMERPESFLDAEDTANLKRLTDSMSYVSVPSMYFPGKEFFGNNSTVGDINIVINQAQINNDSDLDKLATEIGRKFTKQLSKEGLNLAGYAW